MKFAPNQLYHIYNRGNNRQPIFFEEENYEFFLKKVSNELNPFADILGYCLMPNHYHVLICTKENNEQNFGLTLSRKIGTVQSSYTRAINKRFGWTGSVFQQRAKAKCVESYGYVCLNYIHQNPLKAGLCSTIEEWEFSSYLSYAGLTHEVIVNLKLAFERMDLPTDKTRFKCFTLNSIDGADTSRIL